MTDVPSGTRSYAVHHARPLSPPEELCEYDVTGGLPPDAPRTAEECPVWADAEIGLVVRRWIKGASPLQILHELGVAGPGWRRQLGALLARIREAAAREERATESKAHRSTGRPRHRPRSLTPEMERQVRELRAPGMSVQRIATRLGVTEGAVRWVLAHPREDE